MSEQVQIVIRSNCKITCEDCKEFIFNLHIQKSQGFPYINQNTKQLIIYKKVRHHQIRNNSHFSSRMNISACMGLSTFDRHVRKVICLYPGIQFFSLGDKSNIQIIGKIAINDLATKLENAGATVKLKVITIESSEIGNSLCLNPLRALGL
ncbi:hypothetical protein ABFS83_04G201200 [Erythranthe nasuta]